MNEEEVLNLILSSGESASSILHDKMGAKIENRFKRITTNLINLLEDVKKEFPDATYYTASGGLNLMLTRSHSDDGSPNQDGVACSASTRLNIGDGDF